MNKKRLLSILLLLISIVLIVPNFSMTGAVIGSKALTYINLIALLMFMSGAFIFLMSAKLGPLEDLVNEGQKYVKIAGALNQLKTDITDPGLYSGIQDYLINDMRMNPVEVEEYVNANNSGSWQRNPALLGERIRTHEEARRKNFVNKVQNSYKKVISNLSGEELARLAFSIPDKGKKYLAVDAALESGDLEAVKQAYLETFDSEDWRKTMEAKPAYELREYATRYKQIQTQRFAEKNFLTNGKYDPARVREYVNRSISKLPEEEREKALIDLGIRYAATKLKKE